MGVLVDYLEITPEQVVHAAAVGREHHEQLAVTYASTQSQGWDAEAGWVGASGAALAALLDRWASHAVDHHQMINLHHDRLDDAAARFADLDCDAADRVRRLR